MTISDLLKLLFPLIGGVASKDAFVSDFFSLVMREPETEDEIEADVRGEYFPLQSKVSEKTDRKKSTRYKIFRGGKDRELPPKYARVLYDNLDREKFIDRLCDLDEDQKDTLAEGLRAYGIIVDQGNFLEICADVVQQLIKARAQGNYGFDFAAVPSRTQTGQKLPGIPLPTAIIENGKMFIGGVELKLSSKLEVPLELTESEQPYIGALFEAYSEISDDKVSSLRQISLMDRELKEHFSQQREGYFEAEYLRVVARESLTNGEYQFSILKDDVYAGISRIFWKRHESGYERLNAVLDRSQEIQLTKSTLHNIINGIGNSIRIGLCHELVNDGKIRSWVKTDEE